MKTHFLFEVGEWLGSGQVSFSMSPDILYFRTKWQIVGEKGLLWCCTQNVEVVGGDNILNEFTLSEKNDHHFGIILRNELIGTFDGTGVIEERLVAWEFRKPGVFEGYEVYERLHETEYAMHAEYLSQEGTRTMIRGKIWKRETFWNEDEQKE